MQTKTFPILPDLTCPELAGYRLPELPRSQEDDVEKKLSKLFKSVGHNFEIAMPELKQGLIELCKAREKYEFTGSQIEKAILFGAMQQHMFNHISVEEESKFIASLRTPRTPIAIEVEMVEATDWIETHGNMLMTPIVCLKPATNPDGTVKGRWVYE